MYYPILRGKLNELLALRELSELSLKNFSPVIEPVRNNLTALIKTIQVLNDNGLIPNIVLNPNVGDFSNSKTNLFESLNKVENIEFNKLYSINENTQKYENFLDLDTFGLFIQKGIDQNLIDFSKQSKLNFLPYDTSPIVKKFVQNKVLYEDSFKKQIRNADYPIESQFSALHSFYKDDFKSVGFGDYTITGDDYTESGGPAYVVSIHASYIDLSRFDELFIRHYSSKNDGTPTNPGAKFKEALVKLISDYQSSIVKFTKTNALNEFIELHKIDHFPGLGQVKKISIKHHIETIDTYLQLKG